MKKIALITLITAMLAVGGCSQAGTSTLADNTNEAGTYGSDPYLDGLYDDCEGGDAQACKELYAEAPVGSEYEEFGYNNDWPEDSEESFDTPASESTISTSPDGYGDDPYLDRLYDGCESGDEDACANLIADAPPGSGYAEFAEEEWLFAEDEPMSYGDDAYLDGLADDCEAGDTAACDELYMYSPEGSEYEAFAIEKGGEEPDWVPPYGGHEPGYDPL